jgi:hypothetical protein
MNSEIEAQIVADHPEQKQVRGTVAYWNFLPPDELDTLLNLFRTVTNKTLCISKTFGIEGKKLLTPEDKFDDLRDFYSKYDGKLSPLEAMRLELQKLMKENPELEGQLRILPGQVFSGKDHPSSGSKAIFFCYALPVREIGEGKDGEKWSTDPGLTQWYMYDLETKQILEDPTEIISFIRATPQTPRRCILEKKSLSEILAVVDKHITDTYLKKIQAPADVNQVLTAWMELS